MIKMRCFFNLTIDSMTTYRVIPSVRVFYSKYENKIYREPFKRATQSPSNPIPTQSEATIFRSNEQQSTL